MSYTLKPDVLTLESSLDALLRASGADFWTFTQIDSYKQEEAAKHKVSLFWHLSLPFRMLAEDPARAIEKCADVIYYGTVCVFVCSAIGMLAMVGAGVLGMWHSLAILSIDGLIIAASLILWMSLSKIAKRTARITIRGPAAWEIKLIEEWLYDKGFQCVPAKAMDIVENVRKFFPQAKIFVHALYQDKILLDPIIEINLEDGKRVIQRFPAVWNKLLQIVPPPT
jgi:hypothetical protein